MYEHINELLLGHMGLVKWEAFLMHVFICFGVYVICEPRLWVELMGLNRRM